MALLFDDNEHTVDLRGVRTEHKPPSSPVPHLEIGQVLRDRYVLKARLGAGGKGIVFRALDRFRAALPEDQQDVALKVLNPGVEGIEQSVENLCREFHRAQSLSHQNVMKVYQLDRDGQVVFFTMELLEGEPLDRIIKRRAPATLDRTKAWQLIEQLCAGVAHAHERGIVHDDLKPQNVLITRQGELRVLDFGANSAASLDPPPKRGEAPAFGTPAYASCEQLEGRRANASDDLYALACICYELLTGIHPFDSRPATLARDYDVELVRPPNLTGRQWRALQQGLSWHRAARSIRQPLRLHRSFFYVAIAKRDPHQKSGTVIRKQVWLPASADTDFYGATQGS
jgi:serine/threonine protein kinase